jgi:hypothetical protein
VVIEVFDKFLEKSIEVSHNFVHTKVRRWVTSRIGHRSAMIYAIRCGFLCRKDIGGVDILSFCRSWRWVLWGGRRSALVCRSVRTWK